MTGPRASSKYIELTSLSEETGYYDEQPDFASDVWPLLTRHSHAVKQVYLFANHHARGRGSLWRNPQEFITLGPMASLSAKRLSEIRNWSFFGGHLSVFYETSSNETWLQGLFTLWLRPAQLKSGDEDLGLTAHEVQRLQNFISGLPADRIVFAFGHDGDPLYVFGREEVLSRLSRLR